MHILRPALLVFILLPFVGVFFPHPSLQQELGPAITSPVDGDVLQGAVSIEGNSAVAEFVSSEIAFAYNGDPTGTWFLIAAGTQPVEEDALVTWDTTTIADGAYDLRLRLHLSDGKILDSVVKNLRVRNYSPIETPTPMPVVPEATPLPTFTPTSTPFPTPSPLPANPAAMTTRDVVSTISCGGLIAVLFLLLLGIYVRQRRK